METDLNCRVLCPRPVTAINVSYSSRDNDILCVMMYVL